MTTWKYFGSASREKNLNYAHDETLLWTFDSLVLFYFWNNKAHLNVTFFIFIFFLSICLSSSLNKKNFQFTLYIDLRRFNFLFIYLNHFRRHRHYRFPPSPPSKIGCYKTIYLHKNRIYKLTIIGWLDINSSQYGHSNKGYKFNGRYLNFSWTKIF